MQEGESIRIQYVLEDRGKIRARKENKILMVIKPLGLMMLMIVLFVSALPKHGIGRKRGYRKGKERVNEDYRLF